MKILGLLAAGAVLAVVAMIWAHAAGAAIDRQCAYQVHHPRQGVYSWC